ncbi:MAG: ATP-binding protein [Hyphomicrobiales bacterium]
MLNGFSLKSLLPKTLWGQLVSLLLMALLLSQAVALFIFVDTRRMLANSDSEKMVIGHIANTIDSIDLSADARGLRRTLQQANRPDLRFKISKTPMRGKDFRPVYSKRFKIALSKALKIDTKKIIVISRGAPGATIMRRSLPESIRISVKVAPKSWINIDRFSPKFSLRWIAPLLVTMFLMVVFIIVIVSLLVRRLTKPLAALSEAAQKLGRGQDVDDLEEVGTEDVRRVTRSFNQMNQKVKRFVDDRTKMLAAISHDLRTPITSLRLRAEFIEDKEIQAKILETLAEMQAMTEAALKFTKESQSQEKTKNVDLNSLLDTMVIDYVDMGKVVNLQAQDNQPQLILPMRVQSIKRALRNLIDNGVAYGEQVEISFKQNRFENVAEIYICDKGNGISKDEFERVFEPFYRLEKSRNKDTGGVGLGLSIARDIIRGHGGDVEPANITNDEQIVGLEVKVTLPMS